MEKNRLWRTDNIPLLMLNAGEKNYFVLDKQGSLQHFFYENELWALKTDNIFGRRVQGFDAVLDKHGNIHLLGYDHTGSLFYLSPLTGPSSPEPLYRNSGKKISHLSACLDEDNNLHILYLAVSEQHEMWWLFYLRKEKDTCPEPAIIDFGYRYLEQNGLILGDFLGSIFILYRLYEEGNYSLVLRSLQSETGRPGKTFYLPERQKECFFPAFLVTSDNILHISWISCEHEAMFLNYIHRTPAGKWEGFFSIEVPHSTVTIAPLYILGEKLILTWKKDSELFYLFSLNRGKSWNRGRSISIKTELELTRFRAATVLFKEQKWWGDYVFASESSPPQETLYPEELFNTRTVEGGLSEEFRVLDLLSSSLLTYAGNLQTSNVNLKQKLGQKEKEIWKMYSWGITMKEAWEEKLNTKKIELQQIEAFLKRTLNELQERINREKEEMTVRNKELTQQVKEFYKKNEELKKENVILLENIGRLKEQVASLIMENEELKTKKNHFLSKLFSRFQS